MDSKQKIMELNQIEGFNPAELLTEIDGENNTKEKYLLVRDRIAWFRLKYPEGAIVTNLERLDDKIVVFSASIYTDGKNRENTMLAKASALGDFTKASAYKHLETTETTAIGRALALAGFGTQFCGNELAEGDDPADSPVPVTGNLKPMAKPKATGFDAEIEEIKATLTKPTAFACLTNDGSGDTLGKLFKQKATDPIKDIRKIASKKPKDSSDCYIIACAQLLVEEYDEKVAAALAESKEAG